METGSTTCYGYQPSLDGQRRLIVLNFTDVSQCLSLAGQTDGMLVLSTALDRAEPVRLSDLALRPHEGVVIDLDTATGSQRE